MPLLPLLALSSGLTSETKTQTIERLLAVMRDKYVSIEDATSAERIIRARLAALGYESCTDGAAFAAALTQDLQKACRDAHLGVRYSPEPLPLKPDLDRMNRWMAKMNGGLVKAERIEGNVGYVRLDGFAPVWAMKGPLKAAMDFVRDTDALIVDLRSNGGGEPDAVRHACGYFFARRTHVNDFVYRTKKVEMWTARVPGRVYTKPVCVLVGPRTASAAEEFAYDLQTQRRATIVGERTWGGANCGEEVRLGERFSAYVSTSRAMNPITQKNWEGVGVQPDVPAKDALAAAHRRIVERLLKNARDPDEREGLRRTLETMPKS